jgi:hypothetical protein
VLGIEVIGQSNALVATPSTTFPAGRPFDWDDFGVTMFGGARGVRNFELTLENALADDRYFLGSAYRTGLGRSGPRKISGSVTLELSSMADYAYFRNLDTTSIVASWTVNGSYYLTVTMPKCYIQGDEPTVSDAGPVLWTANFEAFQSAVANDELSIALGNAQVIP